MKTNKTKLIINPGSGDTAGKQKLIKEVLHQLELQNMPVDVALAKPKTNAIPIAKQAVKDGYKTIVAMGGDDTIEAIFRGVAGSQVRLGIIPAGTENNVALSLHIPQDPQEACDVLAHGKTLELDLGEIKIKKKRFFFFELVTIGLSAALYPDIKGLPKGDLSRITDAARKILTQEKTPLISMKLDGESKIAIPSLLVTMTNIPYIGLKFLAAPDASMNDGLVDIAVYPDFNKAELFSYFEKIKNGGCAPDGKIQRFRAREIILDPSPKVEVLADGVLLGRGKMKIKIHPGALRVIVPESFEKEAAIKKKASRALPAPVSAVAEC